MRDMKIIDQERQIAKVDKNKGYEWKQRHANRKAESEINPCGYCGLKKMHTDLRSCPAYGKTCAKCQKPNHFASACRADRFGTPIHKKNYDIRRGRNRVKKTLEQESDIEDTSDDDFLSQSVALMNIKQVKKKYSLEKTVPLMINDISVRAEPDSGADVNVMDEFQFRALQHRSAEDLGLQNSKIKLQTLQNELPIKGEFNAVIRNKTCGVRSRLFSRQR